MRPLVLAPLAFTLLAPSVVHAEGPFQSGGANVVSLEGMFGVVNVHRSVDSPAASTSAGTTIVTTTNSASVTEVGTIGSTGPLGTIPFTRLGYHRFFGALSLGTGLYYGTYSVGEDVTVFALAPRLGVAFPVSGSTSLWLRGGITYAHQKAGSFATITESQLLVGGEAFFVFGVAPHVGILMGPTVEVGVSGAESATFVSFGGNTSSRTSSSDVRYRVIGLTTGVLLDFLGVLGGFHPRSRHRSFRRGSLPRCSQRGPTASRPLSCGGLGRAGHRASTE